VEGSVVKGSSVEGSVVKGSSVKGSSVKRSSVKGSDAADAGNTAGVADGAEVAEVD
jgi:hypothetical protein